MVTPGAITFGCGCGVVVVVVVVVVVSVVVVAVDVEVVPSSAPARGAAARMTAAASPAAPQAENAAIDTPGFTL